MDFDKPFPALTPAQRLYLDVNGYVVVENTLTGDEISRCKEAVYRLRDRLVKLGEAGHSPGREFKAHLQVDKPHHQFMTNILGADADITAYATHPRLVGMAEELIGGESRIVEMNAHVNRRDPEIDDDEPRFGFHSGTDAAFATHDHAGLFHCNFVKTLTALTDIGPEDGGTTVIAGSHKIDLPDEQLIKLAYEEPSLIHQFEAPAGSTLLFGETLVHATGHIRSAKERVIIIAGYSPPMFPYWEEGGLPTDLGHGVPENLRTLIEGKAHWRRGPRYRSLSDPADDRPFELGRWWDRSASDSGSHDL
jgi:ectoine hydroxylase-related dioxygenase (phytanoyl-CoA dioxygenase family)